MTDAIHYRAATEGDLGFMLGAWLKSAGDAWSSIRSSDLSEWCRHNGRLAGVQVGWFADAPHRFTRHAVAEILARPTTRAVVACDPEDASVIFGFAVAEPSSRILHWAHVKHALRRNGVGREMVSRLVPDWQTHGATCTYLGRGWLTWASRWPLRWNPHAGR